MRSGSDYLALIPPLHATKPNMMAEAALITQPFADVQTFMAGLPAAFDLDNAIGVQLDATGAWIGYSRYIPIPIQNAFFSFDTPGLGFDQGYWYGTFDAPGDYLQRLDDTTYRRLLYAGRIANQITGSIPDIQSVLNAYFTPEAYPNTNVFVMDGTSALSSLFFSFDDPERGFDVGSWYSGQSLSPYTKAPMTITIALSGQWPTVVDLEILKQEIWPIRPSGVAIDWEITTADGAPVFGLDIENEFISGLDVGAWGADPDWVAQNLLTA